MRHAERTAHRPTRGSGGALVAPSRARLAGDRTALGRAALAAPALALLAGPALAHHPLGGMPMETFAHGVLSGVGHPVLGFDHLFFVAAAGIAAALAGVRLAGPAAYVAAMALGCLAMAMGLGLPAKEGVIAASLLVVGGVVASGRGIGAGGALGLLAAFGLFHGSAFGDSIAAQEGGVGAAVLLGYLLGLGVVQYAVALAAGAVALRLGRADAAAPRVMGALAAGAGLLLALEVVEGPALAALGMG